MASDAAITANTSAGTSKCDAASIVAAALSKLSREGKFDTKRAVKAFSELGIDPEKIDAAIA